MKAATFGAPLAVTEESLTQYDGTSRLAEFDANGQIVRHYLNGPGPNEVLAVDQGGETAWAFTDQLGSVTTWGRYDGGTWTLEHVAFDAFGNRDATLSSATPLAVGGQTLPQLWAGHQFEATLDLYHMQARWYDPQSGRFLSPDPLSYAAGDKNLYRYVGNSAASAVDPKGLYEVDIHHYLIYYLLRSKGWPVEEARTIAGYSQFTDDNPYSWPYDPDHPTSYDERRARDFHFYGCTPDTATVRNPPKLRELVRQRFAEFAVDNLMQTGNGADARLGALLHTYIDTWSHEGFTSWHNDAINKRSGSLRPNYGHADAAKGGEAPDFPYNDVNKAMEAALAISDLIPEIRNAPTLNRATIRADLTAQFAIRGTTDQRVRAIQSLITRRFGDRLSDFEYTSAQYSTDYFKYNVSRDNARGGLPTQRRPIIEFLPR